MTASGDKTLAVWDTKTAKLISSCQGHIGSVRTVFASRRMPGIFASGDFVLRMGNCTIGIPLESFIQGKLFLPATLQLISHLRHCDHSFH